MINFANSYHKYVNRFLEINEAAKEAPAELIRQVEGSLSVCYSRGGAGGFLLEKRTVKSLYFPGPSGSGKNHYSSYFAEIA